MEEQNPTSMRRRPQQARGHERVAAILGAAEQLFAGAGYQATTTNAIAALAGVPIGSLYQFFPNKEAILRAVTARYREEGATMLDTVLAESLPAEALAERFMEALVDFGAQRIAFTRIVLLSGGEPQLQEAAAAIHAMLTERFEQLIRSRAPRLRPERARLIAEVAHGAITALLAMAVARKPSGEEAVKAVIGEARTMLLAYLREAAASAST